jgi:hypothetical protein
MTTLIPKINFKNGGWSKTEARLVKAMQEQQVMIEELKQRILILEKK